ncbi:D-inositol-3-phosphate glycosyltransferase [subsurface metagenome]
MKILMPALHYYPVIGGIETWTQNIAEKLSEKAEVFVVTGKVKNQPKKEEVKGVKVWRTSLFVLSNLSASSIIYSLSLLPFIFFKSLNLIKKEKINILHCQGFLSSFLGFLLSKLTGIPYIITVQRIERKGNLLKEMVYRRAFCCIGSSRAVKRYFEAIGAKNIEVIPNGIDLARFKGLDRQRSRQKPGLGNEFVVMTIARLESVKGIEYLIRAISKLKEASPQSINIKLVIVGDGSERENLESLSAKLGLTERVKFLGQIPNEKIPEYLAEADCFCLPSLREGFGIVILEAQAAGIPVIGTKVGGILDLIEDDKTGILVESKNPEAISRAISKIYANPDFVQNLVQNARINLEKYNWDNISQQVFNIYQKCLN